MAGSTLSTARSVADEIFGLGQSAGWAIPGVGEAVAVFSAVGESLVDLLIPDDAPAPPSQQDLARAINDIASKIDQAFFQHDQHNLRSNILTMNDGLHGYLADALDPKTISAAYKGPLSPHDRANIWDVKFNALIAPLNALLSPIRHIPDFVMTEPAYRFQTLPVFVSGCNLWFHTNRIAILWELNTAMRDNSAAVAQFNIDYQKFRQAMLVWKANQPNSGPKPKFKGQKPAVVLGSAQIGHSSLYADKIRRYIDGYITHLEKVLDEIQSEYDKTQAFFDAYNSSTIKVPSLGGKTKIIDTLSNMSSEEVFDGDVADLRREIMAGVGQASAMFDLQSKDAGFITPRDMLGFRATLASWKQLRSDLTDPTKDLTKDIDLN